MSAMGHLLAKVWGYILKEPAVIFSVIGAGLSLAATYGLTLNAAQTKAVYSLVAVITSLFIRQAVTPTTGVQTRLSAVEAAVAQISSPSPSATQLQTPPQSPGSS